VTCTKEDGLNLRQDHNLLAINLQQQHTDWKLEVYVKSPS